MPGTSRVIALDGPAGSGKSSVARGVARLLQWRYVDTGATYRAATLATLRAGVDLQDADAVSAIVAKAGIELSLDPDDPAVLLDGEDVSAEIRGPEVTGAVSAVSAIPAVRALLLDVQRRAIGTQGAVAEGRDVASVVAPTAAVKVYLDARPEIRAARRAGDTSAGVATTAKGDMTAAVQADLARRDALDSSRAASPLQAAADALVLDTSDLTQDDVVQQLLSLARAAGLG